LQPSGQATGSRHSALSVDTSVTSVTAQLDGTAVPPGVFAVTPMMIDFGWLPPKTPASSSVTIKNTGIAPTATPGLFVEGQDQAVFTFNPNDCTGPLAGGQSCTAGVAFVPDLMADSPGMKTALLDVIGMPGGQVSVMLLANVTIATGGLEIRSDDPNNLVSADFGAANVGFSSATRVFTVFNHADVDYPLQIQVEQKGVDIPDFSVVPLDIRGACGATIVAKGTCQLGLRFQPRGVGLREATLDVMGVDDQQQLLAQATAHLSGTGTCFGEQCGTMLIRKK
jgi:hypothetical protein